jgi:LPXTG-site transpeptidase (sortase) family protein
MNRWNIIMWVLALLGTAVVCAIVILAIAMSGLSPQLTERVDSYVSLGRPATPSAPPGSLGPGGRLVIPSIGVDAGIVAVGADPSGTMRTPDNGWDVGWYDSSVVPGQRGNSVMTGHVDYYDIGPAVFWHLRDLGPDDELQVHLADDGGVVTYEVTQVESYEAGAAPVDAIIGPTDNDVLTLITCTGWFNPSTREYDHRLVVRAERVS